MKNIVIIGGGVAGLTAGIYAQKAGYNSVIVEKHKITGGQLTGWSRNGHHIDNCIHWLTGTNKNDELYRLWSDIGMICDGEIYQSEKLYTYEKNGVTLSLWRDLDRSEAEMLALSPLDKERIKEFIRSVKAVQGIMGIAGAERNEKLSPIAMIKSLPLLLKYMRSDVGDIAKTFDNEVIGGFFTSLLTERFSSLALLIVFATFTGGNGALPKGGSLKASMRITDRYLALGGKLVTGSAVKKVNVMESRAYSVITDRGEEIAADAVIVTADPKSFFGNILDAEMPSSLKRSCGAPKKRRFSALQCAFSCEIKDIPFKGDYIFDLNEKEKSLLKSDYLILREFTHEPSFAPEGKTVLQAMVFVDESECKRYIAMKDNIEAYRQRKKEIENTVKSAIFRKFPQLESSLFTLDVWTPATYKEYTLSDVGSFMGFAFGGGSLPMKISGRIKGVKNVFLATQWQRAPGGLPIAAEMGRRSVVYLNEYFERESRAEKRREKFRLLAFKRTAKQQ